MLLAVCISKWVVDNVVECLLKRSDGLCVAVEDCNNSLDFSVCLDVGEMVTAHMHTNFLNKKIDF